VRGKSHNRSIENLPAPVENSHVAIEGHESDSNQRELELAGAVAVQDIDERSVRDTEALLSAVLCAAWPTLSAQNQ
jgi:hypothetical protein